MAFRCFVFGFLLACVPAASFAEAVRLSPVEPLREGATLFDKIDSKESGIVFESRFENPQLWGRLWRQYFIGSIGSGIALGDVNGDGLPDIFFVGKDSPNALYLNRGDFRFEEASDSSGIALPKGIGAGVAMVDIESDGDLDIYVCYVGSPNQLFVNDGEGRFEEQAANLGLAIETGSNAPSFCDYDRDGDLDLYLQCNYLEDSENPAGMPDFLFENRGGRFVDVTEEAGIHGLGQGHAAIWWDFDEDGWQDLYVANDFTPDDRLYRNSQDGTFTDVLKESFPFAPYSAMGADLGDLNNDGHVDFVVAEMKPRDRTYYLKTVGPLSSKLFSIDKNGVSQYMQNAIVANVGPGSFADVGHLTGMEATDWTWAPRLLDLDCDGWLDAFFTNGMARAFHDADLGVKVANATSRRMQVALYARSAALEERNLAFRNLGGFQFEEVGKAWGLDLLGVSFAAGAADLDQDGDLDLVVGNWKGEPSVYRNLSDKGQRLVVQLSGTESNRFGLGARVTAKAGEEVQVRELTSMRGYMATDEPAVFFSFSEARMVDELRIEWPSGVVQVLEGLECGHRYSIEERKSGTGRSEGARWFLPSKIALDRTAFVQERKKEVDRDQALLPFSEDREGAPLLVRDWNGDGWLDLMLGGPSGQELRLFRNVEGERLDRMDTSSFDETSESEVVGLMLAGESVLVTSGGIEQERGSSDLQDRLYRHADGFSFRQVDDSLLSKIALGTGDSVWWDYDRDGVDELLQAGGPIARSYPLAELNRVLVEGEQGFEVEWSGFAQAFSQAGKIADLEVVGGEKGAGEMLVAASQFGPVHLWSVAAGGAVAVAGGLPEEARRSGYWSCAKSGDVNGDGRDDLILGNLGLNTRWGAKEGEVSELYFSKDPLASPRLFLEATREGESSYPTETRTLHQMYLPVEMGKTGSYEEFGRLTMEEAFGPEVMGGLEKAVLEETRSLLLLQNEKGGFETTALPHEAQAGRMLDAAFADVDSDGDLDAVVVLEPLSPQPWVALAPDKGHLLLLENGGAGDFRAVLPWESGLNVKTGSPKRVDFVDLDRDGKKELLVSVSDGPVLLFDLEG
ncbi:VCBS repeat-containing protein [Pelagicoccus mobilis]|uniref:VCBS repeat-containing protein n=1 Tax=Pelagicoccus mobilis TaxID=415221 RepID=A0A934RXM1_9BACT|nr:VCBS repeat-containing protein [Pelagicoccus mobilis]MBK1876691.1 VCBS repeat-containing protein [Pelagicoccus mobilis]